MSKQSVPRRDEIRKRVAEGFKLFLGQGARITSVGFGYYRIPSADAGKRASDRPYYQVCLGIYTNEEEYCECKDWRIRKDTCKHIVAATIFRAKGKEEDGEVLVVA